jgi:FkbM family methyltransferase
LNSDPATGADRFNRILAEMDAETSLTRSNRWRMLFDQSAGSFANQLVLFGAGEFGKWTLARLRKAGIEPLCFTDNNVARWGSRVQGVEVLSPSDAVRRFANTACFIVTIYNGSAARKQLRESGCSRVLPAALLFWKYPAEFMPDLGIDAPERIMEQIEQIRECFSILSDDRSRQEFCDQIAWRYWMRPEYLPPTSSMDELYFPHDLVADNSGEVMVDCGAFDGDSIRNFVRNGKSFRHFFALEPDAANLSGLRAYIATLPNEIRENVTVWPYAVTDKDGQVHFVESHDVTSQVSSTDCGVTIESRKLDSLPWHFKPTYIKMDIEGSEPLALAGASELIANELPVLAICLYHRTEHLWQIPNLIHSLAPEYSLFLRRHAEDCWEQVCYAVPPSRLKKPRA